MPSRTAFTEWLLYGGASWVLYLTLAAETLALGDYLFFEVEPHEVARDCFLICNGLGRWGIVTPLALYVLTVVPSLAIYQAVHDRTMRQPIIGALPIFSLLLLLVLLSVLWAAIPEYFFASYIAFYMGTFFLVMAVERIVNTIRSRRQARRTALEPETEAGTEIVMNDMEPLEEEEEEETPARSALRAKLKEKLQTPFGDDALV